MQTPSLIYEKKESNGVTVYVSHYRDYPSSGQGDDDWDVYFCDDLIGERHLTKPWGCYLKHKASSVEMCEKCIIAFAVRRLDIPDEIPF